ncbi:MAG TPA: hypothetical protein VFH73_19540 [Polyangia bacterium]|nr:hypothetical protein [Polyangia bacterium]
MKRLSIAALLLFMACDQTPQGQNQTDAGLEAFGSVSFAELMVLLRMRCQTCHTIDGLGGGIDFGTSASGDAKAYASLVSPAKGSLCADQGFTRVVPGDPGRSLIIAKLEARAAGTDPPCGGGMPTGERPALPAAEIDLVRRWIAGGAPGPK